MKDKGKTMLLKAKDYEIMSSVLDKKDMEYLLLHYLSYPIKEAPNQKQIEDAISTNDWSQIPNSNTLEKVNHYNPHNLNKYFYTRDKTLFEKFHNAFKEQRDFSLELYKDLLTYCENGRKNKTPLESEYQPVHANYAKNIIHLLINKKIDYKSSDEWQKSYEKLTTIMCQGYQKDHHVNALSLILLGISNDEPQNKILDFLKTFLTTNKTINPLAKKHLENIKNQIKGWNLSDHFKKNEVTSLYNDNTELVSKRVEALIFKSDINLLKTKNKTKSSVISTNIRNLTTCIKEGLGDFPQYVDSSVLLQDPDINLNLFFTRDVKEHHIEIIKNFIESIFNSREIMEVNYIEKELRAITISFSLDNQLKDKSSIKKPKI